ncbi:hypothetical protein C8R43DRAFT_1127912 [Mycena crocata]|nr:hypothetical protein C8R43DRAFT_1127912 [Mycena crocata]
MTISSPGPVLEATEPSAIHQRLDAFKYPVSTLPNEIVSEIFLHFIPAYPACLSSTGLFSPTLLTHICHRWREVALTAPTLWRAIRLPPDLVLTQRVHLLHSWLQRSSFSPLSLHISLNSLRVEVDVLRTLLQHRVCWEFLKLYIQGDLHIIQGSSPLLHEFDLRLDESSLSPVSLLEAPLLRTAILSSYAAASVILPWEQLTSLTLQGVYPLECTPILRQTSSLVHCELKLVSDDTNAIQPDVNLPFLESLILVDDDGAEETEYLGTFIFPVLRKLKVPKVYIGTDPVTAFKSFVSKSGCKLQEVHITGERSTSEELYWNALPLVPKITFEVQDEGDGKSEED